MKEERVVIENTLSIEHFMHVFTCSEEERENILLMIKNMYPGEDIQLLRNGFQVRVLRKKSDKEKEEYYKLHNPKPVNNSGFNNPSKQSYDELFDEHVTQVTKGKKKCK